MKTSTTNQPYAVIIGASMSGLFAAALLREAGWRAEVFERSPVELYGRGAGITTHAPMLRVLHKCGADLSGLGITVQERIALDRSGDVVERLPFEQVVTSWDRLHNVMRPTVPPNSHHLDHDLVDIEQRHDSVTAVFSNGRRETADLLIGADGYRSTVRQYVAPDTQPNYSGYVIWRGRAAEADLSPEAHASVFDKFAFSLPPRNKIMGYPMPGANDDLRPGHRDYNWVWYRPVDADQLAAMLVDESGTSFDVSIPPPLVRRDLIEQMRSDARELFPPAMLDVLDAVPAPFFSPIYDHLVDRMVRGRVVVIGDAAATVRPHIGMGIAKAAVDAEALADAVGGGDHFADGLALFEKERLEESARLLDRGRELGRYLLEDHDDAPDPDGDDLHSTPGILKHTASAAFLQTTA